METIINCIKDFFRAIKRWLLITDSINRLTELCTNLEDNIELMRGHLESLNGNVKNINEYGSKGAQKCFDDMSKKFDKLDSKVDITQQEVAKIKGFLKMNGFSLPKDKEDE